MIDDSKYIIRKASMQDTDFIVTTIIEAEKSSTNNLGLANYFELPESDLREYLKSILEEDISGCEFSLSSFIVAEYDGETVSASAGWLEGANEDSQPSSILKSNLLSYYIPFRNIQISREKLSVVKDIQIEEPLIPPMI